MLSDNTKSALRKAFREKVKAINLETDPRNWRYWRKKGFAGYADMLAVLIYTLNRMDVDYEGQTVAPVEYGYADYDTFPRRVLQFARKTDKDGFLFVLDVPDLERMRGGRGEVYTLVNEQHPSLEAEIVPTGHTEERHKRAPIIRLQSMGFLRR